MWSVVQDEQAGNFDQAQRRRSISGRSPDVEDPDFEEEVIPIRPWPVHTVVTHVINHACEHVDAVSAWEA